MLATYWGDLVLQDVEEWQPQPWPSTNPRKDSGSMERRSSGCLSTSQLGHGGEVTGGVLSPDSRGECGHGDDAKERSYRVGDKTDNERALDRLTLSDLRIEVTSDGSSQ